MSSVSREGRLGSQREGGPPGLGAEVASSTGALEGQDLQPETPGAETGLFSAVWVPTLAGQEGPRPTHGRQAGRLAVSFCVLLWSLLLTPIRQAPKSRVPEIPLHPFLCINEALEP